MVRWRTIQKVTQQEWGPSSILDHSAPPLYIKDRKARGVQNRMRVIDMNTLILTTQKMRAQFQTPPPPLKDRMGRGLRNRIQTVDLRAQILTV